MLSPTPTEPGSETSARVLRLKRGEDRRLARRAPVGVQQRGRHRRARRSAASPPGELAQLRSHREPFLGYAYVNPHALICARILSQRRRRSRSTRALIEQRLRAALALRERLGDAPLLPLGVRRVRWAAGTGARSLRRASSSGRSPPPAWRRCERRSTAAVRARARARAALFWKNDSAARELEQLPQVAADRLRRGARRRSQVLRGAA